MQVFIVCSYVLCLSCVIKTVISSSSSSYDAIFISLGWGGLALSWRKHHSSFFCTRLFRLLSFHATNQHIWWVLRTLMQKLGIQTWCLFTYGSRESEGLHPGSRCLRSHMQIQKISDQCNRTIMVTGQSSQQAMANTVGAKSIIIDVDPLEDTNIKRCN